MWTNYITNSNTASLFGRYTWCRDYYHDLNASNSSAAENWTQKAFNPFVVCNLPPMITKFDVEIHVVREYEVWVKECYLTITATIRSVSGFGQVYIGARPYYGNEDTARYIDSISSPSKTEANYDNIRLDVDYWTLLGQGFKTRLMTCAYVEMGNGHPNVCAEHEIKGLLPVVVDAITNFFAMLLGGLQKAWEAVQNAVNVIVEWVKSVFAQTRPILVEMIRTNLATEKIKEERTSNLQMIFSLPFFNWGLKWLGILFSIFLFLWLVPYSVLAEDMFEWAVQESGKFTISLAYITETVCVMIVLMGEILGASALGPYAGPVVILFSLISIGWGIFDLYLHLHDP